MFVDLRIITNNNMKFKMNRLTLDHMVVKVVSSNNFV